MGLKNCNETIIPKNYQNSDFDDEEDKSYHEWDNNYLYKINDDD